MTASQTARSSMGWGSKTNVMFLSPLFEDPTALYTETRMPGLACVGQLA